MIWIFGLITGLAFDMPTWWWVMGFIMGLLAQPNTTEKELVSVNLIKTGSKTNNTKENI